MQPVFKITNNLHLNNLFVYDRHTLPIISSDFLPVPLITGVGSGIAYDIVTKSVYYSTNNQWLPLSGGGTIGPTGAQGLPGATGPQGLPGATGAQGLPGATGHTPEMAYLVLGQTKDVTIENGRTLEFVFNEPINEKLADYISYDSSSITLKDGIYQINLNMEIVDESWDAIYTVSLYDSRTATTLCTKRFIPPDIGARIRTFTSPFTLPYLLVVRETVTLVILITNDSGSNLTITGSAELANMSVTRLSNV